MAVKQELLEKLQNPVSFMRDITNLRCNTDAISVLETAIAGEGVSVYTFDRTKHQPYLCLVVNEQERKAKILCWNKELTHIGFDVNDDQFREFDPNPDVKLYCEALTKVIDLEVNEIKSRFVNSFICKCHFGTREDLANEFTTHMAIKLREVNEDREDTNIEQQYDLDDLILAEASNIKELLEQYGTVTSNVHFTNLFDQKGL